MNEPYSIGALAAAYREGVATPREVIAAALARCHADRHGAWIRVLNRAEVEPYLAALDQADPAALPLYGIPFAIKDNIDLAGIPTTAACPDYAYTPARSAHVVERLLAAGAVPLGKTNLDQFAAGLVGTRSPYGVCRNAIDGEYLAGGSSSGSAVAVALGQAAFALGTDTAGSGRIPAAFNGLVGLKPSRGLISTAGIVPACASLDCVSVFAATAADAAAVFEVARGFDATQPFSRRGGPQRSALPSRFRFGVPTPAQREFYGNEAYAVAFEAALARLEALGGERVDIDFAPFVEAARLLYEGPWVAERYLAIEGFLNAQPEALQPVTRQIISAGGGGRAADTFRAGYRLAALRRAAEAELARVDVIVTPTAGTHYTVAEVEADPITLNSNLGYYTNFMNLLDLAACAVPAGRTDAGLPFGITCFADAFTDRALMSLAARFMGDALTVADDYVPIVACGAHMSGLALNAQLTERGARLRETTRTAAAYRFFALPGGPPKRPGLVRSLDGGAAIEVEIWEMPRAEVGGFLELIPAPLCLGRVELENGALLPGFLCEAHAVAAAEDITALGGWRAYLARPVAETAS
ncbi:MAG: allophanate hydrolase [Pseudomonadales bacterium]